MSVPGLGLCALLLCRRSGLNLDGSARPFGLALTLRLCSTPAQVIRTCRQSCLRATSSTRHSKGRLPKMRRSLLRSRGRRQRRMLLSKPFVLRAVPTTRGGSYMLSARPARSSSATTASAPITASASSGSGRARAAARRRTCEPASTLGSHLVTCSKSRSDPCSRC